MKEIEGKGHQEMTLIVQKYFVKNAK